MVASLHPRTTVSLSYPRACPRHRMSRPSWNDETPYNSHGQQITNRQKFMALSSLVVGLNQIGHKLTGSIAYKGHKLLTIRYLPTVMLCPGGDIRISNQFLITRALHFAQLHQACSCAKCKRHYHIGVAEYNLKVSSA